jgi:hypothetical protein
MNNEQTGRMWKKEPLSNLGYYFSICLEELIKTNEKHLPG